MASLKKSVSEQISTESTVRTGDFPNKEMGSGLDRRIGIDCRVSVEEKIKVGTTRLDNLVNMVGELVISQSMVAEEVCTKLTPENELNRKITHHGKVVRELQELSMSKT